MRHLVAVSHTVSGDPAAITFEPRPGGRIVELGAEAEQAGRVPELAVLSAMAHGAHPDCSGVLDALLGALATVDEEHALYSDLVLATWLRRAVTADSARDLFA